jgi:hypothetical protein
VTPTPTLLDRKCTAPIRHPSTSTPGLSRAWRPHAAAAADADTRECLCRTCEVDVLDPHAANATQPITTDIHHRVSASEHRRDPALTSSVANLGASGPSNRANHCHDANPSTHHCASPPRCDTPRDVELAPIRPAPQREPRQQPASTDLRPLEGDRSGVGEVGMSGTLVGRAHSGRTRTTSTIGHAREAVDLRLIAGGIQPIRSAPAPPRLPHLAISRAPRALANEPKAANQRRLRISQALRCKHVRHAGENPGVRALGDTRWGVQMLALTMKAGAPGTVRRAHRGR